MSKVPVLLLGATGFLGGDLLQSLIEAGEYEITVTARRDDAFQELEKLGVRCVKASLDDVRIIKEETAKHDVVINAANSDHHPSVQATLDGIRERSARGQRAIYIHTSGTGVIGDNAGGEHGSDLILYDDRPQQLAREIHDGAFHRQIDLNIQRHAREFAAMTPDSRTSIRVMIPPLIYGRSRGKFKVVSAQLPSLIRGSLAEGYAGMQGKGKAIGSFIDIHDLVDGYLVLLRHLLSSPPRPDDVDEDFFYFCEAGEEFEWRVVSERLGEVLKNKGIVQDATPKPFPEAKLYEHGLSFDKKLWKGTKDYMSIGGNTRCRAVKLRRMGWEASRSSVQALLASIEPDVDVILEEKQQG